MSAQEIAAELERLEDDALYAVVAGLCSRHLETVNAYSGYEIQAREMRDGTYTQIPDEQLPLLAEVA